MQSTSRGFGPASKCKAALISKLVVHKAWMCHVARSTLFLLLFLEHKRRIVTWLVILLSREKVSQLRIEPPTTPFGFGYLSTIIR
jgi:hypothetical protein